MSNPNQVFPSDFSMPGYSGGKELNIRQEIINTFRGTIQELAKNEKGLLRKIRLDASGNAIKCPCTDNLTGEQDRDYYCPVCINERYLFDESVIEFYKVQHTNDSGGLKSVEIGLANVVMCVFYLLYDVNIGDLDKIVQINLDLEGNIVKPIKRTRIWQITESVDLRLDNGRLEFKKLYARMEDVKYLNTPGT